MLRYCSSAANVSALAQNALQCAAAMPAARPRLQRRANPQREQVQVAHHRSGHLRYQHRVQPALDSFHPGQRASNERVSPGFASEELSKIRDKWRVQWQELAHKFAKAAHLVEALAPEQSPPRHQYLDTNTFRFMVSKGGVPIRLSDRNPQTSARLKNMEALLVPRPRPKEIKP
jgi:hypothetical protein